MTTVLWINRPVAFERNLLKQCRFLAGPTASGKSAAGLALAERIGAEILSLDSMAIYRGMDIGTAKPTPGERARIPHHLIDLVDPWESFSVADYLRHAEAAARDVIDRGSIPLFVGGTGLYLRSILRGVFEGPGSDARIRAALEEEARRVGASALHGRLARVDSITAERLHPNDLRRVIRALEVAEATGRPLSSFQQHPPLPPDDRPAHVDWLSPQRQWLYDRIDARVDAMLVRDLLAETRRLLDDPRGLGRTARQALGYRELIDHLEGRTSLPEAVELIKRRTRQFAKRQHTWFRNLEECHAVHIAGDETTDQLVNRLVGQERAKGS